MPEKMQYRFLVFACLMVMFFLGAQNMSAQDATSFGMTGGGENSEEKVIIIKDDPDDTSRWAKIRDIFQSSASKKEAAESQQLKDQIIEQDSIGTDGKKIDKPNIMPQLTGIMSSGKNDTSALVNGYIVKKGDFIDGYTVKKIASNSVILEKNGKEYVLYVQQ